MMQVELVRAWPRRFEATMLELPQGASVQDALDAAGCRLDVEFVALSIHGVAASPGAILRDGDRIELLRALQLDPKQARRLRAERTAASAPKR